MDNNNGIMPIGDIMVTITLNWTFDSALYDDPSIDMMSINPSDFKIHFDGPAGSGTVYWGDTTSPFFGSSGDTITCTVDFPEPFTSSYGDTFTISCGYDFQQTEYITIVKKAGAVVEPKVPDIKIDFIPARRWQSDYPDVYALPGVQCYKITGEDFPADSSWDLFFLVYRDKEGTDLIEQVRDSYSLTPYDTLYAAEWAEEEWSPAPGYGQTYFVVSVSEPVGLYEYENNETSRFIYGRLRYHDPVNGDIYSDIKPLYWCPERDIEETLTGTIQGIKYYSSLDFDTTVDGPERTWSGIATVKGLNDKTFASHVNETTGSDNNTWVIKPSEIIGSTVSAHTRVIIDGMETYFKDNMIFEIPQYICNKTPLKISVDADEFGTALKNGKTELPLMLKVTNGDEDMPSCDYRATMLELDFGTYGKYQVIKPMFDDGTIMLTPKTAQKSGTLLASIDDFKEDKLSTTIENYDYNLPVDTAILVKVTASVKELGVVRSVSTDITLTISSTALSSDVGIMWYKYAEDWVHGPVYIKEDGVWKLAKEIWYKENGQWVRGYGFYNTYANTAPYTYDQLNNFSYDHLKYDCFETEIK